jgi:hypothetical protein
MDDCPVVTRAVETEGPHAKILPFFVKALHAYIGVQGSEGLSVVSAARKPSPVEQGFLVSLYPQSCRLGESSASDTVRLFRLLEEREGVILPFNAAICGASKATVDKPCQARGEPPSCRRLEVQRWACRV